MHITSARESLMGEELKKSMEQTCSEFGTYVTIALTIFAKKITREKRIPFVVSIDSFYSQKNLPDKMNY